ncbi:MAG: amidase, partial [Alsobacter sp.]
MTSILSLSAVELRARYRDRSLTPAQVMDAVIAHAERREPELAALYAFDPDGARAVAAGSTTRWSNGEPMGPLDGVP